MWTKLAWRDARRSLGLGLIAAALIALPSFAGAQPKEDEELDELGSEESEEPSAPEGGAEEEEEAAPEPAAPPAPPPPPIPTAPPPSPFTFVLKGMIASTLYMQDVPTTSGNGGAAIFGPITLNGDKWLLGGDIRQSRVMFTVRGPEVLSGATPVGIMELDLGGGNQITSVPAGAPSVVRDAMGMPIGSVATPAAGTPQGDESLLPRVRVAYVELNWGMGQNILRVGQFHNLLLPMIAASASHTGTPLGYGAGQLGWRSPGITYLHRFTLGEDTNLDIGLQINRNSWIDNLAPCATGQAPPTTPTCVPYGVSLGEASGLPQFEGRVMLSGGKAPSPWPMYAPNVWQVYVVGHWDQKDLSGVGSVAPTMAPPGFVGTLRDSMDTLVVEGGFKLRLGPLLVAANGWVGKNTGGVYGNLIQFQLPHQPDVSGFGGWGQLGFSFTPEISIWAFGGMDKPNADEAKAAGFTRLQNLQIAGMLAYVEGPLVIGLEYLYLSTDNWVTVVPANPATMTPEVKGEMNATGSQIALTLAYNF